MPQVRAEEAAAATGLGHRRSRSTLRNVHAAVRELAARYENSNRLKVEVKKVTGRAFYNTSNYEFANLLADADGLAANLADHIDRLSADVDVFQYLDFKKEILALEKAGLLREIVKSFGAIDLHADVVSNADMGDAIEYRSAVAGPPAFRLIVSQCWGCPFVGQEFVRPRRMGGIGPDRPCSGRGGRSGAAPPCRPGGAVG